MNEKSYNDSLKKELDNLSSEHERRFNLIIEQHGVPSGKDSEEISKLNKWFAMEAKRIKSKYNS